MRIQIPFPSLAPHGGTRVAIAIANRLAARGHAVEFFVMQRTTHVQRNYWSWSPGVRVTHTPSTNYDVRLITSPHSIHLARPRRTVLHLQMLEHLFSPGDAHWQNKCVQMYKNACPLFTISMWNYERLISHYGRKESNTFYIGNGVDEIDFPRQTLPSKAQRPYVLVEGWAAYNPCKDVNRVAPQVAARIRDTWGIDVVAYGQVPPTDFEGVIDQFYHRPTVKEMRQLYGGAQFLLKASRYDARSCSPVEAMTQGTPTIRAIEEGDDDLVDGFNCIRTEYSVEALWDGVTRWLGMGPSAQATIRTNMRNYVDEHLQWKPWIDQIEAKLLEVGRR